MSAPVARSDVAVARDLVAESQAVLRTRARSFRWGSFFLPEAEAIDSALVYAFCRLVDDTADEATDATLADHELGLIIEELSGSRPPRPLVAAYLDVARRRGIHDGAARELLLGCRGDCGPVVVADDDALLLYSYRVAGTVGLMMCGVLGVTDRAALPRAIDLGIAMQLTNICRDVAEDAAQGRVYLPASRLRAAGISPDDVVEGRAPAAALFEVVSSILALADRYYASAEIGMKFIPARARLAVLVAARLYRSIGVRLLATGPAAVRRRTVVGAGRKLLYAGAAGAVFLRSLLSAVRREPHPKELHQPLRGMPGVSG